MSKTAKEGVSLTKFGEILMQLRQEKHLSQAELGHIIYVSGGTISNYEKGVHYPDVEKLVRLADYFNVSIDYLLGRAEQEAISAAPLEALARCVCADSFG